MSIFAAFLCLIAAIVCVALAVMSLAMLLRGPLDYRPSPSLAGCLAWAGMFALCALGLAAQAGRLLA